MKIVKKKHVGLRINRNITAREVRLIGSDGTKFGIVSIHEAIKIAGEEGLDLVEVSADSSPPVCKLIDYGRYKYDSKRKAQEAKKKQTSVKVKEVQLSLKIGMNDLFVKLNNAHRFLKSGNKAKIVLTFKGREMAYRDMGQKMLDKIVNMFDGIAMVELAPRLEGRRMAMILAPLSGKNKPKEGIGEPFTLDFIVNGMKDESAEAG